MTILQALILGTIQGLAEMLPISSSAHLVLLPWLFHFPDPGLSFDVALHVGTLVAILGYFWREWLDVAKSIIKLVRERKVTTQEQKLAGLLLLASIPGAVFGFLLGDLAESTFRSPLIIAGTLVIMGVVLWYFDHHNIEKKSFTGITTVDAVLVGLAQAVAIIPGVSRSGATITAGLALGVKKEDAAKFSFLMSAPIIAGAAIVQLPDLDISLLASAPFWVGIFSAMISSMIAIKILLSLVRKHHFDFFVLYRFVLAAVILAFYFTRI